MAGKHPKEFTVKAWSTNAIAFIEDQGLTREFSDWCGGWPCPVDPKMITAAPKLVEALREIAKKWPDSAAARTARAAVAPVEPRHPLVTAVPECPMSHDGRHHIDTSMEEGPHHCFHCGANMCTKAKGESA